MPEGLLGCGLFFMLVPAADAPDEGGALRFMMTILAMFMPVAMIWVAATAARASRVMREESQRLQGAIGAIRQAYLAQSQARGTITAEPSVARKLEEIAETAKKTETAMPIPTPASRFTHVTPITVAQ